MTYQESVAELAHALAGQSDACAISALDLVVRRFVFTSDNVHGAHDGVRTPGRTSDWEEEGREDVADAEIAENRTWWYEMLAPPGAEAADGVIIMLHGLNERSWAKYHPWAADLVRRTGKTVVLWPIAFHMQRSPASWSHPRRMSAVLRRRQDTHPGLSDASHANAALSARLESDPARFFWSGLQSCDDVMQLVRTIRAGGHPAIAADATLDLFGYSIGASIAQLLLLANPEALFSDARALLFCGGATLERSCLRSRYILDSAAVDALHTCYLRDLDAQCVRDAHFRRHLHERDAGRWFRAMLDSAGLREQREGGFRRLVGKLCAVALVQDQVVPAEAVRHTLQGEGGDIPHPVHILDFPFPYSHIAPFSANPKHAAEADEAFRAVFDLAGRHLS